MILIVAHMEVGHHQIQLMRPLPCPSTAFPDAVSSTLSLERYITGPNHMIMTKTTAPRIAMIPATTYATSNIPGSAQKDGASILFAVPPGAPRQPCRSTGPTLLLDHLCHPGWHVGRRLPQQGATFCWPRWLSLKQDRAPPGIITLSALGFPVCFCSSRAGPHIFASQCCAGPLWQHPASNIQI